MTSQLQHAYLEPETGPRIECMFNPATFGFSTSNRWEADAIPGKASPAMRFAGSDGGSFSLSLVFDTTATGTAVTEHTNKLLRLMKIDTNLPSYDPQNNNGRPPWVRFGWGTHLSTFKAVITSLDVTFTYFSDQGLPLRANVDLSLEQYEPDETWAAQNPTSGTPMPDRSHQVQVGDTLDRLAARYYGDSTKWRVIANGNGISDPLTLTPGTVLAIPEHAE